MRNIGEIISSNRKKLKLSQPMLAELLQQEGINLTVKAISKWETNATEPSVATFLAVLELTKANRVKISGDSDNIEIELIKEKKRHAK